jgi:hypothetical protein
MSRDEVNSVLDVTLAVLDQIAKGTRTPADDLMVGILRSNRERLAEVVLTLLQEPAQPLSTERVAAALSAAGIRS